MKKYLPILIALLALIFPGRLSAESNLAERLKGYFLIQAESRGELWFVNPKDKARHPLGAGAIITSLSSLAQGIKNKDLEKIPPAVDLMFSGEKDSDNDGLPDSLEKALGTDLLKADTDSDGFSDLLEIKSGYSPLGKEKAAIDLKLAKNNSGKIFIQVESHGELWYVNPKDNKRYFFGNSSRAFNVVKKLALGIKNIDLEKIPTAGNQSTSGNENNSSGSQTLPADRKAIDQAASAIRSGSASASGYFTDDAQSPVKYTLGKLDKEGRLALGNIISASSLTSSKDTEKIYTSEVYFSGEKAKVNFKVKKVNGQWLLANL